MTIELGFLICILFQSWITFWFVPAWWQLWEKLEGMEKRIKEEIKGEGHE